METGSITLEFSIQKNGRIRGLETIAYEPNDAIEFHARRSIRQAIYRPAMVEGEATVTPAHRYVHTYPYFPSRKARAKEQEALEQQTDPETEPAPVPDLELEQEQEQEQQADQPANDENDKQKSAANFRGTIIESANANNA
jgi:hypothetical protein